MNWVSTLIYWSGVVESVGHFFYFILTAMAISVVGLTIAGIAWAASENPGERDYAASLKSYGWARTIFVFFFLLGIITNLIPSQNTVLMIAASEMGETVVTSPANVELFNTTRDLLLQKLKETTTK